MNGKELSVVERDPFAGISIHSANVRKYSRNTRTFNFFGRDGSVNKARFQLLVKLSGASSL